MRQVSVVYSMYAPPGDYSPLVFFVVTRADFLHGLMQVRKLHVIIPICKVLAL
jgi:hypothetical protein